MIYNITKTTFNEYGIRSGDMIAIINFLQWFRKKENNPNIQLHFLPDIIKSYDYCQKFYKFLHTNYDYFTDIKGDANLPFDQLMLWDFRDIIGDHVSLNNFKTMKDKITIFPIYDAGYHTYRNWTSKLLDELLKYYSHQYPHHEKLLCVRDVPTMDIELYDFVISTDYIKNINHIMESKIFIGGDTGVSHFASALDKPPSQLIYYYNGRGMLHTLPFHLFEGKGTLKRYWHNCYKTTYNGELVL